MEIVFILLVLAVIGGGLWFVHHKATATVEITSIKNRLEAVEAKVVTAVKAEVAKL